MKGTTAKETTTENATTPETKEEGGLQLCVDIFMMQGGFWTLNHARRKLYSILKQYVGTMLCPYIYASGARVQTDWKKKEKTFSRRSGTGFVMINDARWGEKAIVGMDTTSKQKTEVSLGERGVSIKPLEFDRMITIYSRDHSRTSCALQILT